MKIRVHIAKPLANLFGSCQSPLPDLSGGWGRLFLLTTILLLAVPRYVHAQEQNKGKNPYLDSEHAYQVSIGVEANDREWVVTNDAESSDFPYTITKANYADDGLDWFEVITTAPGDGEFEQVEIYFDRDIFSEGTYYLQYFEYEDHGSGKICISARQFEITVTENTFYLLTGANGNQCNAESGKVHTYEQVDNDTGTDLFSTTVSYTVTMNKGEDYSPDNFSFDAAFDETVTNFEASVTTTDGGTASFTEDAGGYTVSVVPGNGGSDPFLDEVEVTLSVTFNLPVLDVHTPELSVSNGQAVKDGTPQSITYDNETVYPVSDPGDREQIITINDIPATRNIGFGDGESDWSAKNPLQNSTHNYTVEMESATNNSDNTQTGWYITQTGSDVKITESATTFALTPSYDTDNSLAGAGIIFYFEYDDTEASNNEYTIYFTEQNDNDCSTIREYPVTIQAPFDVDIAAVDDDCSGADEVIYDDVTAAVTEVTYTINLKNSTYEASWQFNLELACDDLGSTLSVSTEAGDVSGGTMGTLTNENGKLTVPVTVKKSEGVDVSKQVTVTVKYSGTYTAAHTITASIVPPATPGSFGSYGETDIDDGITLEDDGVVEGEINQAQHIIYAMPQPGAIAGVD
jgi:hypothetical protein